MLPSLSLALNCKNSVADKIDILVIMGAAVKKDGTPSGALARRVNSAIVLGKEFLQPCYLAT